jgi:predicted secreted hydrolase
MRWTLPSLIIALLVGSAWLLWPHGAGSPGVGDGAGIDPSALLRSLALHDDDHASAAVGHSAGNPLQAVDDAPDGALDGAQEGGGARYRFPGDHGAHPDARTEVWDVSGQLADSSGQRFGFRLTLVRVALLPAAAAQASRPAQTENGTRASALAADTVITGRFALAQDAGTSTVQRISRAAAGLAGADLGPKSGPRSGAESAPMRVWLEDWTLTRHADGGAELVVVTDQVRLALSLRPEKQPVTAADAGLFQRTAGRRGAVPAGSAGGAGAESGDGRGFSFYMQSRLSAEGSLERRGAAGGDMPLTVVGSAWLDHAWGGLSETLNGVGGGVGGGQLALNRFALQLDDGSELMCLQLRRRAGGGTPIPTCLAIGADGGLRLFERRELSLEPFGKPWSSPAGDAAWPLGWRLAVPALDLELSLEPLTEDQEVVLGERLWSGAVSLSGQRAGAPIAGSGRMDLSGYVGVGKRG